MVAASGGPKTVLNRLAAAAAAVRHRRLRDRIRAHGHQRDGESQMATTIARHSQDVTLAL